MKKSISLFVLLFSIYFVNAQDFSGGVVLGNSFYGVANGGGEFSPKKNPTSFSFGLYGEYAFNNNIGIKTDFLFSQYKFFTNSNIPFEMGIVTIAPNFKYDFGENYREGFYMVAGPKITIVNSAKSNNDDVKDIFNTPMVGVQLGFGWRIFRFVDLQTKFEYDIDAFYEFKNGNKSSFFGGIISANIDIARLISNK